MSSTEQSTFEAAIADACTKHKEAHWQEYDYRACVSIGTEYFVKFDNPRALWPEIATHKYISEYAQAHADTPRMPRISKVKYHFGDKRTMYMVMEYITLTNPPPDLPERTAEAVRWLSGVPAPPGHVFGPLGGGPIRHSFFKDHKAPLAFSSIGALERYIEKVPSATFNLGQARMLLSTLRKKPVESVSLSGERLMFMQPDMDPSNFGVDEHGNTVLMDFAEIAILPESFAAYMLSSNDSLASSLGLSKSFNVASMAVISSCLWMVADSKLGLNEDGYPKASIRKR
ncbi:hypothetical protein FIBSPDRAFT_921082 [Athelia psychrophila]|uniref:Aminoglycoside phosphotransferase domain-containing protein n=1 Tax=Athelia psychrophila TaxID=1759441 RepID=A0A166ECA4_9AGAM|nr:hypothetical protein FIBSPDRAFT_921082 [Fibularhizoctonia sp. CBS 109695]